MVADSPAVMLLVGHPVTENRMTVNTPAGTITGVSTTPVNHHAAEAPTMHVTTTENGTTTTTPPWTTETVFFPSAMATTETPYWTRRPRDPQRGYPPAL